MCLHQPKIMYLYLKFVIKKLSEKYFVKNPRGQEFCDRINKHLLHELKHNQRHILSMIKILSPAFLITFDDLGIKETSYSDFLPRDWTNEYGLGKWSMDLF